MFALIISVWEKLKTHAVSFNAHMYLELSKRFGNFANTACKTSMWLEISNTFLVPLWFCWVYWKPNVCIWKHFRVTGHLCTQRPVTRSFDVSLTCSWINGWVNNRVTDDLRRHRIHYNVTVMVVIYYYIWNYSTWTWNFSCHVTKFLKWRYYTTVQAYSSLFNDTYM